VDRRFKQVGKNPAGVLFASCAETSYLSLDAHRASSSTRHQKSIWSIKRADECHVFCVAESGRWSDPSGHYWSVASDGEPAYGTRGERMAFFSKPVNVADPWHGFPFGMRRGLAFHRSPPSDLVDQWYHKDKRITYTTYMRIVTRRI
jgi:hypothetical protein